ncbi:MAG TPA: acyl-CoA dehydrogenase family protein, partial [Acidimicrobiia bacterium]|nr:acyl-CoA dehydrogenase family protein [Acidimicrobiia bacterium]
MPAIELLAEKIAVAQTLADEVLFPAAMAVDRSDAVPIGHFDRLAEAGLYALAGPPEAGGFDSDPNAVGWVLETLAGGCLATAFVWAQHHGVVRMLHCDAGPEMRERWLGPACRGEVRGGLALAGLLPGPPKLRAEPTPDGWRLDGTSPWVTGWGRIDALRVGARTPDGRVASLLVDAVEQPGLTAVRQRLVAVDASATVTLVFDGVEVPAERLGALGPHDEAGYGITNLRSQGALALGVAGRCCRLLGPSGYDDELAACRQALDDAEPDAMPVARAGASELALRVAAALVVSVGG